MEHLAVCSKFGRIYVKENCEVLMADETAHDCYAASLQGVREAAKRIAPHAHITPVLTCSTADGLAGRQLFFKCEIFQRSGSFKFRGACNAVLALEPAVAQRVRLACDVPLHGGLSSAFKLSSKPGVVTHSSGNHGQAVALAAKLAGISADVVVPLDTPQCKVDAIEAYGATVYKCEPTIEAREATAAVLQAASSATFIPPYNYRAVICGQGTMALELMEQVRDLDAIVVPVSGGGMISGIAVAAKGLNPSIRIIGAEPYGRNDAADVTRSIAAGKLVPCPKPQTIADGLQGRLGDLTWPIVRDLVDEVIPVSEEEIVAAMRMCFERMKVVVEPSGAVGLAAVLSQQFKDSPISGACQRVGVILCGGNVDLAAKGLWDTWLLPK